MLNIIYKHLRKRIKTVDGVIIIPPHIFGWLMGMFNIKELKETEELVLEYLTSEYGDEFIAKTIEGTLRYFKNGQAHRDDNLPAMITEDGDKAWVQFGDFHRDDDKPAIIYVGGRKEWWRNGKRHRDNDKPAIITENGVKHYYKDGIEYEL